MNTARHCLLTFAALSTALAATVATTPASAQFAAMTQSRIMAMTPLCGEHPDFPVIGRVVGYYSDATRSVRLAFVGCFPSFADCESWRREALQPLDPPILQNRCERR